MSLDSIAIKEENLSACKGQIVKTEMYPETINIQFFCKTLNSTFDDIP